MSNLRILEVNIPQWDAVTRYSFPLASGEVIKEGQWFTLDASGDAVLTGSTPNGVMFLNFMDTTHPSVSDTQTDNIGTGATPVQIATGGVVGLVGKFRANVDNNGYDDGETFNQFDPLTSKLGKLVPQAGVEPIIAFVYTAIGADARLHFITV